MRQLVPLLLLLLAPERPLGVSGDEGPPRFRSRVDVIAVTATVRAPDGSLATGLTAADFEIFEDGVRQRITQFTSERVPISLALLLDISESMKGQRIEDARAAVQRFLSELLDSADEFVVVAFNHDARVIAPWTREAEGLQARLDALRPWGGTAIHDAVLHALPLIARRSNQRAAVVLISDGADTASDASVRDVRIRLLRSDAFVYAIAVDPPDLRERATRVRPDALRQITDDTGGHTAVVHDADGIAAATDRIAEELNHQYVLGYNTPNPADGEYHSIRVRVKKPGYRVQARRGYVAER